MEANMDGFISFTLHLLLFLEHNVDFKMHLKDISLGLNKIKNKEI